MLLTLGLNGLLGANVSLLVCDRAGVQLGCQFLDGGNRLGKVLILAEQGMLVDEVLALGDQVAEGGLCGVAPLRGRMLVGHMR